MPLVAHDPGEPYARGPVDRPGDLECRRPGRDAGPIHPDVDVHDHRDLHAEVRGDCRGEIHLERVVGADHHLRPVQQPGRPLHLASGDEFVGDQHGRHAALDHHLGLRHLGARDADRAERHLLRRDPGGLVALRMRAPVLAATDDRARQAAGVRLEAVEIEQHHRGIELRLRHPDGGRGGEQALGRHGRLRNGARRHDDVRGSGYRIHSTRTWGAIRRCRTAHRRPQQPKQAKEPDGGRGSRRHVGRQDRTGQ